MFLLKATGPVNIIYLVDKRVTLGAGLPVVAPDYRGKCYPSEREEEKTDRGR